MSHTVRRLLGLTGSTLVTGVLAVTTTGAAAGTAWTSSPVTARTLHSSIVIARAGHVSDAAAAVRAAGGKLGKPLPIINGFTASVSSTAARRLSGSASIASVTPNSAVTPASSNFDPAYDPTVHGATAAGSVRAPYAWNQGDTGKGVTVALLDTGVTPVADLAGRVTGGVDLSGEGNSLQDSYGHGTVMAGLIAGNGAASNGVYPGVAPGANIVSVKVAGRSGATDVSQILLGLQWIGTFGKQRGIDLVNIAWGTPTSETSDVDPLDFAVERLWAMGITVVVAAGNDGPRASSISAPGDDPAVITAGAYADLGTIDAGDDTPADFSSRGPTNTGVSKPDVIAPGRTIVAAVDPNSSVAQRNPGSLVDGAYITGSGTSQATAVTTGAAALFLSVHHWWTPDQVKYALTSTTRFLTGVDRSAQGAGEVRLSKLWTPVSAAPHQALTATGLGTLEGTRAGRHVSVLCPGDTTRTVITGEMDARCVAWTSDTWASDTWDSDTWDSDTWDSDTWDSDTWDSDTWASDTWDSDTWDTAFWDPAP